MTSEIDYAAEWQKKEERRLDKPYERSDVQWTLALARKVYAQDTLFLFDDVWYTATPQTLLTVLAGYPIDQDGYPSDVDASRLMYLTEALVNQLEIAKTNWLANKAKAGNAAAANVAKVLAQFDQEAGSESVE